MAEDISYYHVMNDRNIGQFVDFLSWFFGATNGYPNEEVNDGNLDIYFNHMHKCVDRFVRDARKAAVMKIKIDAAWSMLRAGDDFSAVRMLQQAQWVILYPDDVPELRQPELR